MSKQSLFDSFDTEIFTNELEKLPAIWDWPVSSLVQSRGWTQYWWRHFFLENFLWNNTNI